MLKFLSGLKTHTVAIGMVLSGIGGYLSGAMDAVSAIQLVLNGLGISALRDGIRKLASDAK